MRILMIAPEPFLEPRGTPFSVYHRAKALVTLGYEVDLVTYPIGKPVTMPGLHIYRTPSLPCIHEVKIGPSLAKLPLDALLFLTATWRLCLTRYRYIHTHEEAGLIGVVLASVFRCKHLYDMHSDLAQQMSNFAFASQRNPLGRLLIRCVAGVQVFIVHHADAVIVICPDLETTVKRMEPRKPVSMIENVAVDEALPPPAQDAIEKLRQQWRLEGKTVLLYTGTFESYQGIDLLLRSIVYVKATCPTAYYMLVGGRPEQVEQQRQRARELGISEHVCFVGQRPLEEMPLYTALADVLLSPRSEGTNTPLKLYTYLRSGKPILATAIMSHTQILTSLIAKLVPATAEGLARGALELLQEPEVARALGEAGRLLAEKEYSWPAFLEKNRRSYDEFIANKMIVGAISRR